jgi:putative Holliday junction resolvase
LAVGLATWINEGATTIRRLKKFIEEENIRLIVVGYPLTLRGEIGPKAREVDTFIQQLQTVEIPIERWDERWTTAQARRSARDAGLSEKQQRGRLDVSAAILLLQSYLDAHPERPDS